MILVSGLSTVSASSWYTLTSLSAKAPGYSWGEWQTCNVQTSFNYDIKRITIYSNTVQIFDYTNLVKVQYSRYMTLSGYVSDRHYTSAYMIITLYDDGRVFLHFQYSNGEYMYALQ